MTAEAVESSAAGLLSPVALFGAVVLLVCSPVMRGGNRHVALVLLELLALVVLAALALRASAVPAVVATVVRKPLFVLLLSSPVLLAVVYLTPMPASLWNLLPGRAELAQAMQAAGVDPSGWHAASISPPATAASLLAALPLVACMLVGFLASIEQLRTLMRVVIAIGFAQVALALGQTAGGEFSPLFFGVLTFGPPVGTFANRNHFANYLAMALVALVWLAYESHRDAKLGTGLAFTERHRTVLWACGGLLLVLGVLLSRSRGAALFGLPFAALALGVVCLRLLGWSRGWKLTVPIAAAVIAMSLTLVGYEAATSRISTDQLATSADFRGRLARTSFEGALAYLPLGSGWGTYDLAYPRFQPASLPGFANQAHMDYVQMFFEGGVLFLVLGGIAAWLLARRTYKIARRAWLDKTLSREYMAATLCGMGMMVLLLHSLVEFNMRIPANAMLGAMLAGAFLRPLHTWRPT